MQVTNGQCQPFFPQGLGASEKPVPPRRAAHQQAGKSGAACLSPKGEFRAGRLLGAAQGSRPQADR